MIYKILSTGMLSLMILLFSVSYAQSDQDSIKKVKDFRTTDGGTFSLGLRSTGSFFGVDGNAGFGAGGQFRLQLMRWVSTEWFADYITTNISDLGKREDFHIGWSVMFYPFKFKNKVFQPYLLAGHCFDYTKVTTFNVVGVDNSDKTQDRWSMAAQLGIGSHFNIGNRFDVSISAQYMFHLGKEIHADIDESSGQRELHVEVQSGAFLEGHLLVTLSLNVKIADLWKSKK